MLEELTTPHSQHCSLDVPDLDVLSVVSVMKLTITGYSANIPSAAFHNQRLFLKCSHLGLALKCLNCAFLPKNNKRDTTITAQRRKNLPLLQGMNFLKCH